MSEDILSQIDAIALELSGIQAEMELLPEYHNAKEQLSLAKEALEKAEQAYNEVVEPFVERRSKLSENLVYLFSFVGQSYEPENSRVKFRFFKPRVTFKYAKMWETLKDAVMLWATLETKEIPDFNAFRKQIITVITTTEAVNKSIGSARVEVIDVMDKDNKFNA